MDRLTLATPVLLATVAGCAHAPPASLVDRALLGCWRVQEERQVFRDGKAVRGTGGCTMEFGPVLYQSRCTGPRTIGDFLKVFPGTPHGTTMTLEKERVQALAGVPILASTYQYRIDRPGHYAAVATESTTMTLVGWLPPPQEAQYRFDGDRLEISVGLPPLDTEPVGLARVESILVRVTAENGASECLPSPVR